MDNKLVTNTRELNNSIRTKRQVTEFIIIITGNQLYTLINWL